MDQDINSPTMGENSPQTMPGEASKKAPAPVVIDVTIRDGGLINSWRFSRTFMTRHLAVCETNGLHFCEVWKRA